MKKTKPSKNTISLLMLLLLSTSVLAYLPITAIAHPVEIEVMSIYTEPEERAYWDEVLNKWHSLPGQTITVKWTAVEMDDVFDAVMRRHTVTLDDPDAFLMHSMWLPKFADYRDPIVSNKTPSYVVSDVKGSFIPATVAGATYKGVIYGYPTEFNSHALVFNHKIFNDTIDGKTWSQGVRKVLTSGEISTLTTVRNTLLAKQPITYTQLTAAARLLTQRGLDGTINMSGFMPYIDGNEEKRFEFMNLLLSNNGTFLDLSGSTDIGMGDRRWGLPEALFNSTEGVQALALFSNLNENALGAGSALASYDPDVLPDIYGAGWGEERIAMVIIPTWFTYVRGAMGARFTNLGIAPIPIGPNSAATTKNIVYTWMGAVSEKAQREAGGVRAAAAWQFLWWLHQPRSAGYIVAPAPIGNIPKTSGVSIMGDWLITDSVLPSRIGDQVDPRLSDFWFAGFLRQANLYGVSDKPFLKSEEVQDKVGMMFERVAGAYAENPEAVADETAADVNTLLPAPGDINVDGVVGVADAVIVIKDWFAVPTSDKWFRGRADVIEDNVISGKDGGLIVRNYGTRGDP